MEVGGNGQEAAPQDLETEPHDENARGNLDDAEDADEPAPPGEWHTGEFFDARRAEDAIFVFGDAFPAEKAPAFRATRRSLASRVIEAALLNEMAHGFKLASRHHKASRD
ncbi:MAG: hypothetical protein QOF48_18 [Verrucomicrobiota bacterium]